MYIYMYVYTYVCLRVSGEEALGTLGGPLEAAPGELAAEHDRREEPQLRFRPHYIYIYLYIYIYICIYIYIWV